MKHGRSGLRNASLIVVAALALHAVSATGALAQTELKYQKRANRYEGIRPKPVSGYDIELREPGRAGRSCRPEASRSVSFGQP